MRMDGYTVITPVSVEPITLTDVKAYCRVDFDDDDALLASLLTQCRGYAEGVTRRSIAVKTLQAIVRPDPLPIGRLSGPVGMIDDPTLYAERVTFSPFGTNPFYIELPFPPVQAITTLETQLTAMDVPEWVEVDSTDDNGNLVWRADVLTDPALISFSQPLVASQDWHYYQRAARAVYR